MKKNNISGFTILEVMIFVAILSIVLVTAASFITKLLVNIRSNEHRNNAIFLADDVKEWLSGERDSNDWTTFQSKASTTGITYCMNQQLDLTHTMANLSTAVFPSPEAGCPTYTNIQTGMEPIYKREVVLQKDAAATQVSAFIKISWLEIGRTETSITQSNYSSPF